MTRALAWSLLRVACGAPPAGSDAGSDSGDAFAGVDVGADAGSDPRITWSLGPELPGPLASATAQIVDVDGVEHLHLLGGSVARRGSLGTVSSAVLRSAISSVDGSLGAWEPMGDS